jgi:hypothetical protein
VRERLATNRSRGQVERAKKETGKECGKIEDNPAQGHDSGDGRRCDEALLTDSARLPNI